MLHVETKQNQQTRTNFNSGQEKDSFFTSKVGLNNEL